MNWILQGINIHAYNNRVIPRWHWRLHCQRYILCLITIVPKCQNSLHFALHPGVFEHKVAKTWLYSEWPWILTVKRSLYTPNTYPIGPNFCPFHFKFQIWSIHSMISPFQDIAGYTPLTTMLKYSKSKGINGENQNLKFHNSLNNFEQPSPGAYVNRWKWSIMYFQIFNLTLFPSYGLMLTKISNNKNNITKVSKRKK